MQDAAWNNDNGLISFNVTAHLIARNASPPRRQPAPALSFNVTVHLIARNGRQASRFPCHQASFNVTAHLIARNAWRHTWQSRSPPCFNVTAHLIARNRGGTEIRFVSGAFVLSAKGAFFFGRNTEMGDCKSNVYYSLSKIARGY